MIVDGLRAWLNAQATITTISQSRVWPNQAPQRSPLPHIVITRLGEDKYPTLEDTGGHGKLASAEFEIECKAATPASATALAAAVGAALKDYSGAMGSSTCEAVFLEDEYDDYEKPTDGSDNGTHVTTLEVQIQYR